MAFLYFPLGAAVFYAFRYFPYLTTIGLAVSVAFLLRKRHFLFAGVLLFGVLYALIRQGDSIAAHGPSAGRPVSAKGVFTSAPKTTGLRAPTILGLRAPTILGLRAPTSGEGFSQGFKVGSIKDLKTGRTLHPGETLTVFSDREFEQGRRYRLKVIIKKPERLNPGDYSRPYAVLMDVIETGGVSRLEAMRARLNALFMERFGPERAGLLMALTTGERRFVSEGLMESFNSAGLTHLLSISGTHFGLMSILLFSVFRLSLRLLPYRQFERLTVYITPNQMSIALALPVMLFYLGISGGSVPAVRSFVMINIFLVGLAIGRKSQWLISLAIAASLLTLWRPDVLLDLSFLMSFSAVLFIGYFAVEGRRRPGFFKRTLVVTVSALLGVAPLVAYFFHRLSLVSPVSNLIVTPLVGFALVPASIAASFCYIAFGAFPAGRLIGWGSDLSVYLTSALGSLPFSEVKIPAFPVFIVLVYYACFFLYMTSKRKYILALPLIAVLLYIGFASAEKRSLTVTFLDAGRGDSSVVELPDGKALVVDTGISGRQTKAYLDYRAIKDIDALVLSHSHADHTGGAGYLIGRYRVKEVWDNGRLSYPEGLSKDIRLRSPKRGDFLDAGDYRIYVLHPYKEFYCGGDEDSEENNHSLVIKVEGKRGFLFTGDIETEAQDDMARLGKWLRCDLLKAPHHGSSGSAHEGFLNAVSPEVAIVTGKKLSPRMKAALKDAKVFFTAEGAVKIEDRPEGLRIKRFTDSGLKRTKTLYGELENLKRLFAVW